MYNGICKRIYSIDKPIAKLNSPADRREAQLTVTPPFCQIRYQDGLTNDICSP